MPSAAWACAQLEALGELIAKAGEEDLGEVEAVNVRELKRGYERARKVPAKLVKELSKTCSEAHEAWLRARKAGTPDEFLPFLERLVALKTDEAKHLDPDKPVYDVLLDEYERDLTQVDVEALFKELKAWTVPFVQELAAAPKQPDLTALKKRYPIAAQEVFGLEMVKAMGFDFNAGRADTAAHPFCGGVGPRDVRLTTRYHEDDVLSSFFSFVHEAGHGLYEQGLDEAQFGLPAGEAASMAFHESQSRLWENFLARSRPFWEFAFPRFQAAFGEHAAGLELDSFHHAVNAVEPSYTRVEADEVTYNLHVILRFELERDLFAGALEVKDIEAAWNARTEEMLGFTPPSPNLGFMQDIHWSFAGFGYFPTYTYGNLYAAQIHEALREALPNLDDLLRAGNLRPIRDWLKESIHRHGGRWQPTELVRKLTGRDLHHGALVRYLEEKYRPLYGL